MKEIIKGNSDIILDDLIDKGRKYDLILTDPPYNIDKDFGNDSDSLSLDDFVNKTRERLKKCYELLTPTGSIVWFCSHRYLGYVQVAMYETGFFYRRMLIWHYRNAWSRNTRMPITQYDPFLWFSKSDEKWTYNTDDVRVPYRSSERLKHPIYKKDKDGNKKQWIPNPLGAMRGDIFDYPTLSGKPFEEERTEHPTQKPESLITELIKCFCPKNKDNLYEGSILDPFLGSGTTVVCCEKLNNDGHKIKWTGIELEDKWCDVSKKRVATVQREKDGQLPLVIR